MILSTEIYLGDDSDCETCGSSWNRLEYSFDTAAKLHRVETSTGCYGGESLDSRDPDIIAARVRDYFSYPARGELEELTEWLELSRVL